MRRRAVYDTKRLLLLYGAGVLTLAAVALAVSVFPIELGLARADESANRAVIALSEVDAALDEPADYVGFSEALLVAHATYRALPTRNAADNAVGLTVSSALDCYDAIRESWQLELEGVWDPAIQGRPEYWRSFHPSVALTGAGSLDPAELRETLRAEGRAFAEETRSVVER